MVVMAEAGRIADAWRQRNDWRLIADGIGIHWPQVDEDLSVAGIIDSARTP